MASSLNLSPPSLSSPRITDFSPFEGFPEFDWGREVSYQSNQLFINEFKDLENFNLDFNLPLFHEDFEVNNNNQNPLNAVLPVLEQCNDKDESVGDCSFAESSVKIRNEFSRIVKKEEEYEYQEQSQFSLPLSSGRTSIIRDKKSCLQYDEIKKHFDFPISLAANRLNIGVTLLKKRCRELNITRWPHRKLKSLMLLMANLKEMGLDNEVAKLEKQKKLLEKIPGLELNEEIKKLSQVCFKNCYKKRRLLTYHRSARIVGYRNRSKMTCKNSLTCYLFYMFLVFSCNCGSK